MWIAFNSFSTIFERFLPYFHLHYIHCVVPESLLNHLSSFCGVLLSLMQNWMQMHCSTCSVILNAMATQYRCSLNEVYCPHWLVQCSHHCALMHFPVYSPWLPGYINIMQTILIILTMAVLFLDIPFMYTHTHMHTHHMHMKTTYTYIYMTYTCSHRETNTSISVSVSLYASHTLMVLSSIPV